jgi:outer membrane protein OmpA-like peptidoglycan-associated protein
MTGRVRLSVPVKRSERFQVALDAARRRGRGGRIVLITVLCGLTGLMAIAVAPQVQRLLKPYETITAFATRETQSRFASPSLVASADAKSVVGLPAASVPVPVASPPATVAADGVEVAARESVAAATNPAQALLQAPTVRADPPAIAASPAVVINDPLQLPRVAPSLVTERPPEPSRTDAATQVALAAAPPVVVVAPVPVPKVDPCLAETNAAARQATIWFATGSARVPPEDHARLEQFGRLIASCQGVRVEIGGHTDPQGIDATNFQLSWQRAEAVLDHLRARGIDVGRFDVVGFGTRRPLVPVTMAPGGGDPVLAAQQAGDLSRRFARNRRVEFTIR